MTPAQIQDKNAKERRRKSERINFTVRDTTADYLDQLIALGYGNSRTSVLQYFIRRSLDDLLREGVLMRPRK